MKIAAIADVHANLAALSAALSDIRSEGIDHLIVGGDLVGYYFQPSEVFDALEDWNAIYVRGNHEDMLLRAWRDPEVLGDIRLKYGSGIDLALSGLRQATLAKIDTWPATRELTYGNRRFLLCHGSPSSTDQYLYPDCPTDTLEPYADEGFDLVICGHSHYPMLRTVRETRFLNPGSLGQPRNGQPGAHWAIIHTGDLQIEHRISPYDSSSLVAECRRRHPELPYLHEILTRR